MAFLLGSLMDGMFGGARTMFGLKQAYQSIQAQQLQYDAAQQQGQMATGGLGPSGVDSTGTSTPIDTTVPTANNSDGSTPAGTAAPAGPVADPSKLPTPDSQKPKPAADTKEAKAAPPGSGKTGADRLAEAMTVADTVRGKSEQQTQGYAPGEYTPPAQTPPPAAAPDQPAYAPGQYVNPGALYAPSTPPPPVQQPAAPAPGAPTMQAQSGPPPTTAPNAPPPPTVGRPPLYPGMAQPGLGGAPGQPTPSPSAPLSTAQASQRAGLPTTMPDGSPTQAGALWDPGNPGTSQASAAQVLSALRGTPGIAARAGEAPPAQQAPAQPAPAPSGGKPSLGSRLLSAINPIGTAQASEAPAPAAPAAPASGGKQQAQAAPNPAQPGGPSTATTQPAAKVAPQQAGPTQQSEPTPKAPVYSIDPRPFAALSEQAPRYASLVSRVATEEHVDPLRLAWHWYAESGLKTTEETSKTGAIGPLQIEPGTAAFVDPNHQYNPGVLEDALHLAAKVIHMGDARYGQDTPLSVASYTGGIGGADAIQAGKGSLFPSTVAYMRKAYPGQDIDMANLPPGVAINVPQAIQAGMQGGPDGFVRYLVQTTPQQMVLTDKWRAAEAQIVAAAGMRGGVQGAMAARDFVLSMAQQGSGQAMMAAYKALASGDSVTAAQQLARAHTFFPDGSMGRFGVDKSGHLWAERLNEKDPTQTMGQPFEVTTQGLQAMLVQTQDPNKFLQLVGEQQRNNALSSYYASHGQYYGDSITRATIAANAHILGSEAVAGGRVQAATVRADAKSGGAMSGQDPAAVEKEANGLYKPDPTGARGSPADLAAKSVIYQDLRLHAPAGQMPSALADNYAQGLISGAYILRAGRDGTAGIFPRGAALSAQPDAIISGAAAQRFARLRPGAMQTAAAPPSANAQPSPVPPQAIPMNSSAVPRQ